MRYRKLGQTGLDVSILSYGASSLGSVFEEINESEGMKSVHAAVDLGVNLIDVSPYYGLTKAEIILGKALKNIPRDKYLLSSKAGKYGDSEFDFSRNRITKSLEESLQRLGTDYLDIFLLHDIEFGSYNQILEVAIPTLEQLKEQGKIRFYGVSGLPLPIFDKVLRKVNLDVVLSYCHYTLNDNTLLSLIPLLNQKQVGLINASPLSMGLLSSEEVASWHPADEKIKRVCKMAAKFCEENGHDLAKLAIQYSVQNELIPTTRSEERRVGKERRHTREEERDKKGT